jgi:hypothetical protein
MCVFSIPGHFVLNLTFPTSYIFKHAKAYPLRQAIASVKKSNKKTIMDKHNTLRYYN